MGTVGSLFPTTDPSGVTAATGSPAASSTGSSTANDPLAKQATFLQLLVAQLKNQDPTQPVDGTTFVTQLAEFSNVEQNLASRQDLDAISQRYLGTATAPSAAASNNTTDPAAPSSQPASAGTSNVNSPSSSQQS